MRKRMRVLPVVLVGAAALAVSGPGRAADPVQVSGTVIATTVELHLIPVGDDQGHIGGVVKFVGSNTVPGRFAAQVSGVNYGEMVKDVGTYKGYYVITDQNGTISGSSEAKFKLVTVDGKQSTLEEGIWEWTGGTGRYAHVRGKGTFTHTPGPPGDAGITKYSGTATGFEN